MLYHRATALAALLLLTACTAWPGPGSGGRETRTYLLEANPLSESARQRCLALVVGTPSAAPGYDTSRMAYTEHPHRLDYFAFHRWARSPSSMLQTAILRAFQERQSFRYVVAGPEFMPDSIRIDSNILRLRQDFTVDPAVEQFDVLVNLTGAEGKLLLNRRYRYELAAPSGPYAGVQGANAALQQFLEELVADVEGATTDARLCTSR